MKKLVTVAVAAAFVLSAGAALAQPEARDAGVFADPAGTQSTLDIAAFTPFNIYVVGFDLDGQVAGYEGKVSIPVEYTILAKNITPSTGLDFGNEPGEFIVGTGSCLEGAGAFMMVNFNLGLFAAGVDPTDTALCLGPSDPTSFDNVPGYLQCDGTLIPFGVAQNGGDFYPNGCLILNPSQEGPVSTESTSFGEMKARF